MRRSARAAWAKFTARDTRLDRTVAIKMLPSHLSENPILRQRFEREAKAISSLNHPHIRVLHDIGNQHGIQFLVMECVEGETLAKRLEKGPLPLEQALKYGMQIADALDKAHRSGVVHRDLKPGNIVLSVASAILEKDPEPIRSEGTPRSRSYNRLSWTLVAILSLSVLILLIISRQRVPTNAAPVRFFIHPPENSYINAEGRAAVSPDGRHLTFVAPGSNGKDVLRVRSFDSLAARSLAGTEGALFPFWSSLAAAPELRIGNT